MILKANWGEGNAFGDVVKAPVKTGGVKKRLPGQACNIAISVTTRGYRAFIMKFSNFLPLVLG